MSARPEDKEQRKVSQTTPMEASMKPPLGEKEGTAKRDRAEAKSMEESNSNSPPEERPPANQHQKHSTGVAAPMPTPAHGALPPLASAPTPLWKGITGMISNTVSKVFGGSREESESESDTGEPSRSYVTPAPPQPQPSLTAATREVPVQDEQELKRARHVAARAYALGLGEEERAYYGSTVDTNAHVVPVQQQKPERTKKRKVFTAPSAQHNRNRNRNQN
jgi:hypothetical protein